MVGEHQTKIQEDQFVDTKTSNGLYKLSRFYNKDFKKIEIVYTCNLIYNGCVFLYTVILVHNEGWYVPIAIFVIDPNRLFKTQIGINIHYEWYGPNNLNPILHKKMIQIYHQFLFIINHQMTQTNSPKSFL